MDLYDFLTSQISAVSALVGWVFTVDASASQGMSVFVICLKMIFVLAPVALFVVGLLSMVAGYAVRAMNWVLRFLRHDPPALLVWFGNYSRPKPIDRREPKLSNPSPGD